MNELKPCPFCGGSAMLIKRPLKEVYWVSCIGISCYVKPTTNLYYNADKAIEAWNRRAK